MIIPVGVEKLARFDFAKTGSRQEALRAIFPSLLDIFYHPNFGFLWGNRLFQQPQLESTTEFLTPFSFVSRIGIYGPILQRNRFWNRTAKFDR